MTSLARPRLVVIDGIDGCGKSTQVERLAAAQGWIATREPGGTSLGAQIRALVLHREEVPTPLAEALLMAADRAQHVATVIMPALDAGMTVISDRYASSTVAYQGDLAQISTMNDIATGGLVPAMTVLLDIPVAEARLRRGSDPDRLESLDTAFHERVRTGFLSQAIADPERWTVVDATGSLDEVSAAVDRALGLT